MSTKKITEEAKIFNREIGQRIKVYRSKANLTLREVSESLGITLNQVILYEKGAGDLRVSRLKQLADLFQIPLYELFPEQDLSSYQPLSIEIIQFINYITKNNLNLNELYKVISNYKNGIQNC